jgi:hypothetical protein
MRASVLRVPTPRALTPIGMSHYTSAVPTSTAPTPDFAQVARYGMEQLYLTGPDGYLLCFQWRAEAGIEKRGLDKHGQA